MKMIIMKSGKGPVVCKGNMYMYSPGREMDHDRVETWLPFHRCHGHCLYPSGEGPAEVDLEVKR
jgi:hypothetical protein